MKEVAVDDPITKDGVPVGNPFGLIDNIPKGVVVPIPNHPVSVNVDVAVAPNQALLAENRVEDALVNVFNAVNILAVYVLGMVDEELMYAFASAFVYVANPVTCDAGRDRLGRVVILEMDVVAAREVMNLVSNRELDQ